MRPTPKSLVLDLLSSLRGAAMPVRALIAAGAVFDIQPESIRVALVRLCAGGTVEHNQRGQYRIAAAAQPVQRHVVSWARIEDRLVPWRGGWIGVQTAGVARSDRTALRRHDRALAFSGFRPLVAHLFARPDNLRGGVDGVRADLAALGLDAAAPVFSLSDLDPDTEHRARLWWDAGELRLGYRSMTASLTRSAARLPALAPPVAMAESFILGGQAIRQLALDPLLPKPIVPAAERTALIDTMRAYDRLGRAYWRDLMRAHGAPHLRGPRSAVAADLPAAIGGIA
jgi:phenylacetic acid degradation operon negative regulatory protein